MRDTDLYAQILGVESPWTVESVDFDKDAGEVKVSVKLERSGYTCPECGKSCPGYDENIRQWRHLDTCQYATILQAPLPRVECPDHGVLTVKVPWAEQKSRFTLLFERLVIDLLRDAPISSVAKWTGLTWDQVDGIMGRAVARGLLRRDKSNLTDIGIDETSSRKGHNYLTIIHDKDSGDVLYVGEGRDTSTVDTFYEEWSGHLAGVRSVSMDLWPAFLGSTRNHIEDAEDKICLDRFHVSGYFNKALDLVRRKEHSLLRKAGDERLNGTKYDWLRTAQNIDGRSRRWFHELIQDNLKTARAWAIKETAVTLWSYRSKTWAKKMWTRLLGWMSRSRLDPMVKLATSLRKNLHYILNAILLKEDNARAESINSRIQKVKKMACGFRNIQRFKNAILFRYGGLDLYPSLPTH
jgi:transposase